ncbi:hypothetical protein CRUP_035940 [Coryphaenoides rupestris]|nr:hypothetical protein CRUP_035940 [Coryphaenoides rupestris]
MYQLPVGNIERIRKSRRKVKNILSELGLEDCQNLLKWPYRSQILCCALCKYSTRSLHTFKSHVSRCHNYEYSACALDACLDCHYVGHPRALRKHVRFFHTSTGSLSARPVAAPQSSPSDRYLCRRCGYLTGTLGAMKKHVLLRHLESLAQEFIGYKLQAYGKVYICKAPLSIVPAAVQSLQNLQGQQIRLPQSSSSAGVMGVAQKDSKDLITPQGTMMTSQSLLTHLIPTGKRINGLPTYTFAPSSVNTPLKPVAPANNSSQATKKWITCPHCNELFPCNVYEMHMEIAHRTKSIAAKSESVAVRAPFLKKMPDKTVKCLMCNILLSEQGVIQHLLHGLNCLYCSALFFSLPQLIDHLKEQHPKTTANCDLLRQEYRVYTDHSMQLMFPYFDITTTAPKDLLGDMEINLVLVTGALDLIFLKMLPSSSHPDICQASVKISSACCPFCFEKFQNPAKHLQHLKQKHFVAPTVHAILKTEAYKCRLLQ